MKENKDDLISRKALLEEIKENQWGWFSREMLLLMLENQPSVTDTNVGGKWIPCSEKLPEIAGFAVLATLKNKYDGHKRVTTIFTSYGLKPFWCCNNKEINLENWEVIAWMPLPPVYKGD